MDLRDEKCGEGKNRASVFGCAAARVRLRSQLSSVYANRANVRTVRVRPVAMRAQPKGVIYIFTVLQSVDKSMLYTDCVTN